MNNKKMNQNIFTTFKTGIKKRLYALITLITFFIQFLTPAYAVALSSGEIQDSIDAMADIQFVSANGSQQYQAQGYVDTTGLTSYPNIKTFFERLRSDYKAALPAPELIPIAGEITIFVPAHIMGSTVGDTYVQSRYIRDQIQQTLRRNIIDAGQYNAGENVEYEQIKRLYDNAFAFSALVSTTVKFGEVIPVTTFDRYTSSHDMIWPEYRTINGKSVLVPVVYLKASTIDTEAVDQHTVEIGGTVNLEGLNIEDVDVTFRSNFINLANDFTANNANINFESESVQLVVGGKLSLLSSAIIADNTLAINAHSIEARTLVQHFDLGATSGGFYGEITSITAGGSIVLVSQSDVVLQGVVINAGDEIIISADGNIYIGTVPITTNFDGYVNGYSVQRTTVEHLQSSLTAEENIQLIAAGHITLDAAEIVSTTGHIEILAGLGITVEDELNQYQEIAHAKFGRKKIDKSVYQTVAVRSLLDAGKGIKLHTDFGDINLKSVDITSTEGTKVRATNGGVNLLMTTETDHYSYSSVHKKTFTTKTKSYGHNIETGIPNTIVGGLAVEALTGVTVEYKGDSELTVSEQIDVLNQFEGLGWMAQLRDDNNAEFIAVLEVSDSWYESNTSLSPAAVAVLTIAVAVAAGPAAGQIATTVGTAAGSVGLGAAAAAGFTSLVTTAAISLANGNSLENTLESLSSDENLKSLAISMVTAGAIAEVDAAFFKMDTAAVTTAEAAGGSQAVVDSALSTTTKSLTDQVLQAAAHAAVQSAVRTIVNGDDVDDFGDAFVQALAQTAISRIGEELATEIGEAKDLGQIDTALQYVAHAGVGCLTGTLTTKVSGGSSNLGCYSGAGGAVVGEAIGQAYEAELESDLKDWMTEQTAEGAVLNQNSVLEQAYAFKAAGVDMAKLSAALTAFTLGGDISIAAATGANAAENNALGLIAIIAATAYTSYVSYQEGGLYEGLQAFGTGEHPLAEAMNSVTEQAAEMLVSAFPNETKDIVQKLNAAGEVIAAGVQVVMTTPAGKEVTRYWHELSVQERNALVGTANLVSVFIPAGVVTKLNTLSNVGTDIELNDWVQDLGHSNWDKISPEQKNILLAEPKARVIDVESNATTNVDPRNVAFSQTTVSYNKSKTVNGNKVEYTYDDLVASMVIDGWDGEPLNVVRMPDGGLSSLDNTRLLAAREAGIDAEIIVFDYNDVMPDAASVGYSVKDKPTPTKWGEAITLRIGNQDKKDFRGREFGFRFPYGSIYDPKITGKRE